MPIPVNPDYWKDLYRHIRKPPLRDTITGFNMNLDRIIPVTRELFDAPFFVGKGLLALHERLSASMRYCTAEEWFVPDAEQYRNFVRSFSGVGQLAVGGQAGIAALHLSHLGVSRVVCAVPTHGSQSAGILRDQGIIVPDFSLPDNDTRDHVHLVFEYSPGLVPLAPEVQPRNNRFIVSPVHEPSSIIIPEAGMDSFLSAAGSCQRAFLSGYQYLRSPEDYRVAAGQIAQVREQNPEMRVHIEWVSVTDADVLDGCVQYILPRADSLGLNENELLVIVRHLGLSGFSSSEAGSSVQITPLQIIRAAIALCESLRLKRLHVHTYGLYVVVRNNGSGDPVSSRNALLFAAREAAAAAGGSGISLSQTGIEALSAAEDLLGPAAMPGIFPAGACTVIIVPTLIAQNISRTTGLGDILSSTAFVADEF